MCDSDSRRLWGPETERAIDAFAISGRPMPRRFLRTLGLVKQAAAETNAELGLLDRTVADAIAKAAEEVAAGRHGEQFPVDIYQTGSGTSTNMNANEVIAALATASLPVGQRAHPHDHVNRCQSSNDVIPTTMQLAAAVAIDETLLPALDRLRTSLDAKAREFWPVVKLARTHLQNATPIRLGQEFHGYAGQVEECVRRTHQALSELLTVPLGGTATGTGVNCHPDFAPQTCARLASRTGLDVRPTTNHFQAQSTLDVVVTAHGLVKTTALAMWKIASDIRLLGTVQNELSIPDAGVSSSIMPRKAPPAVVESATMVAARVVGNDATIAFAQTGSLLQLNVMMPVAAETLLESIDLLAATADNLAARCVAGLVAKGQNGTDLERSLLLVTALSPVVGHDAAVSMAREAERNGQTIREIALDRGLDAASLDGLLDPQRLAGGQAGPPATTSPP